MGTSQNGTRSVLTHGWFALAYWSLVAIGLVAVVLALTVGSVQQRVTTGVIVFLGVILLSVARFLMARRRRDGHE